MNKTEKLLAARKKLKEFQLNKITHHQEVISHQNDEQKVNTPQNDNITNDPVEKHYSIVNDTNNVDRSHESQQLAQTNDFFVVNNEETVNTMEQFTNSNEPEISLLYNQENTEIKVEEDFKTEKANRELSDFFRIQPNQETHHQMGIMDAFQSMESNVGDQMSCQTKTIQNGANFYDNEIDIQNGSFHDSPSLQNQNLSSHVDNMVDSKAEEVKSVSIHSDVEQTNLIEQLRVQLQAANTQVSELQVLLAAKDVEFEEKLLREVKPLRDEIQVHTQTIKILVAEKAELGAGFSQYQVLAQQKSEELDDLGGKLKFTQSRVAELEKDLSESRDTVEEMHKMYNELQGNHGSLREEFEELKKVREEQQLEAAELRQDLNMKNAELTKLHREIEETKNLLSLAELKIQQLTNMPQERQVLEAQQQAQATLDQKLAQLHENFKSVTLEKDEMCKHYESYVKQLDTKYEKASQDFETARKTINDLEGREESLIQRLSLMEQQYQREKQKVESLLPLQTHEDQIKHLTKSMDSLVLENESLQSALREKDAELESIKEEIQELRELRDQSVETSKLATALESEQLGASRAVSQNQQLKLQLDEMHDAFVMLSNSKLNLTEQLQDERIVGRKLNGQVSRLEAEMDQLKEELIRKDAVIEELEKEKLHSAQIADQMQHYQVQSSQARTLQDELQNALSTIESLKSENQLSMKKFNSLSQTTEKHDSENLHNGDDALKNINEEDPLPVTKETIELQNESNNHQSNLTGIDFEAQQKLERRFKDTMERVAELTDEKQRLEHLVLQLQGETETIGEYITLYQKQRSILQMKAQEREQTFRQLVEQRNQQQVQLHQLKVLVADLLKSKENVATASTLDQATSSTRFSDQTDKHEATVQTMSAQSSTDPIAEPKDDTTSKILDLLTEIKDCKDTCSLEPNFHPCLWCSGKLITV